MHMVTGFPSRAEDDTFAIPSRLAILSSFSFAKTSTENVPLTSVAVVMTGWASMASAISSARLLAPPTCPERSGMTKLPFSSMTMTGGSFSLSRTNGATALTAIPAAPINTSASLSTKASPHTMARGAPFGTMTASWPERFPFSFSLNAFPLFVK